MAYRLMVKADAEADVNEAFAWYEGRSVGLGNRFLQAVRERLLTVAQRPLSYPAIHNDFRRARVDRFPYAVIFAVDDSSVIVVACMHFRRSPRAWLNRATE